LQSPQVPDSFGKKLAVLVGVALLLTGLYVRDVGTIPIFSLLKNSGDEPFLAQLREDSFKLLNSPLEYFYFLTRGTLYPLLIAVSFGCYLWARSRKWLVFFLGTLFAGILFASFSLAKKPVATIFLVMGLFTYFYRNRTITFRKAAAFFCLVFLFPVIVIMFVYADNDFRAAEVTQFIAARLLYGPSEVVYYYFEVFPEHVRYLHGRSIGKLSWALGMNYFDTPNYVGRYGWPQYIETINANGAFISDLNADFGLPGVLLGGVVAGGIMQWIHIFLVRRRKTIIGLACYAFVVYEFWDLNSTSLPTLLASNGTLLALGLMWLMEKWIYGASPAGKKTPILGRIPQLGLR
jgi:hypothetical protein